MDNRLKKLIMILLVSALCLSGITSASAQKIYPTLDEYEKVSGKEIKKFNEAPMLKTKVAAGELPSVEERLPEEPFVVEPRDEIGRYGGTMWGDEGDMRCLHAQHLFEVFAPDFATVRPNVAKGWKLSKDAKTLTVYLRKGMKWSDGYPFTADDILFWYEDIILNDELTPAKPSVFVVGGELMKVEKLDDYTVQFKFVVPYPFIIDVLASYDWWRFPFPPKHYVKKWHIKYNSEANKLAQEEGFEYWWQAFNFHQDNSGRQQDTNLPTINPWMLYKIDAAGNKYYIRNPYYWKIDTAGNQLPYIDEQAGILIQDLEVKKLKVMSGEFDVGGIWQALIDYPTYKRNEKEGNYRAMLWTDPRGAMDSAFTFNQTHKDPVLRKIFEDIRFRQAMSLAIDREDMNESVFYGRGVPRQAAVPPPPINRFFEPWMAEYFAEYDPQKANELLDEMGLRWDDKHQYRLRPDGKTLTITIEYVQRYAKICELIKEYWGKVGIRVNLREVTGSFWSTRRDANELDVGIWAMDMVSEFRLRNTGASRLLPPWTGACVPWRDWYQTGGKSGEEPPNWVKELYNAVDEWKKTVPGSEEYMRLGKKIATLNVKNLSMIGAVGLVPYPVIIKNTLGNTPSKESFWSPDYQQWVPYLAEEWFFKK